MIEKQLFGNTGHLSTRTIFGAAALSKVSQDEADRTLEVLLEYGINHIDTAATQAREQGLVRFIGVTGHGTTIAAMHKQKLERFNFDSVLLPYNYPMMQNPQYAVDFEALVILCQERNVAVQTIKSLARRPWGDKPRNRNTWYEPFEDQADIDRAVHWVLSRPALFLNTVADIHLLPKVLDAASRFQTGPSEAEMRELGARQEMTPLFV